MIERVHIKNFRCLRDLKFDLAPLTVLVGPNAAGKSSILKALHPSFICNYAAPEDVWQRSEDTNIEVKFWLRDNSTRHLVGPGSAEDCGQSGDHFNYRLIRLALDAIRADSPPHETATLASDGSNLTNLFASLTRKEQIKFADQFCQLVPVFKDLDHRPANGRLQLRFHDRWEEGLTYTPEQVSDGTMLMLAYLILQYETATPDVVAVEEPERGLHPYLIEQLITLLRGIAHGKIGRRPMQFVLATHSAELLNYLEPEEVRFVDRDRQTGETSVKAPPTDSENWDKVMESYLDSLGSVWLSGKLGGVPGGS